MTPNVITLPVFPTSKRSHWAAEARRRFVAARHACGLTQEAAGQVLGRDRKTVQRWEAGVRAVPAAELLEIEEMATERERRAAA